MSDKEILDSYDVIDLDEWDEEESSEFKDHKQSIADELAKQLIKKGWTPGMLAERTGLSIEHIQMILNGDLSIGHKTASQLALALECDISEVDPSRKGEAAEIYKD